MMTLAYPTLTVVDSAVVTIAGDSVDLDQLVIKTTPVDDTDRLRYVNLDGAPAGSGAWHGEQSIKQAALDTLDDWYTRGLLQRHTWGAVGDHGCAFTAMITGALQHGRYSYIGTQCSTRDAADLLGLTEWFISDLIGIFDNNTLEDARTYVGGILDALAPGVHVEVFAHADTSGADDLYDLALNRLPAGEQRHAAYERLRKTVHEQSQQQLDAQQLEREQVAA